jgi:hypothetical protein
MPGTAVPGDAAEPSSRSREVKEGHLAVSELATDRAAALSPFGDDQTFPLPADHLTFIPTSTA